MKKEDKYIARELFKAKVLQLEGQAFEDFFVLIMKRVNPQFQSVRAYGNIGDQKNDGFDSTTGTYYQVFAPDNIAKKQTIQEAVKKLENDFSKLYEYWNNYSEIKKFYFVINDKYKGVPPLIIKKVGELNKNPLYEKIEINTFKLDDLQRVFEKLDEDSMLEVIGYISEVSLGMVEYSALNEVVEYLLNTDLPEDYNEKLVVPDFDEKIQFNNLSETARIRLVEGSYQEGTLEKYFNANPGIREILQKKFHALYIDACKKISASAENYSDYRFYHILNEAAPKKTISINACVLVLMSYYFSSCDIFEEPQ